MKFAASHTRKLFLFTLLLEDIVTSVNFSEVEIVLIMLYCIVLTQTGHLRAEAISEGSPMERKAHYDSILDRSKRITWQDDCYVDLQSTSCSISSQADTEGKSLSNRFIPSQMHCCLWSG